VLGRGEAWGRRGREGRCRGGGGMREGGEGGGGGKGG